ncbi:MAG: YHS domain-containing protein [Acidimicrobiales bacterium]|nr:YHS domain-containing protein [Acidimicrobiales bacterium]
MTDVERTVVFLDLTRFTALTDIHGDETAADIIDRFVAAVQTEVDGRGRLVKTLGDGVLLDISDPAVAIEVADRINHRLHRETGMPEVTGGITTGTVIERGRDILGTTVNLAARLADLAPAGELRTTEQAARAAASAGWRVEPLGPTDIRGFHESISIFAVRLCHPEDCTTDPVCGMRLTPGDDTPQIDHDGVARWFCSAPCLERFRSAPGRYLA